MMPNEHTNVITRPGTRACGSIAGRPQIQEEAAVVQLVDLIMEKNPARRPGRGHGGQPLRMSRRGVREMDSKMINSVMRRVPHQPDTAPRVPVAHSRK